MQEDKILIPEGKQVTIGGKIYNVGKLSMTQSILLTRLIANTILINQAKLAELKKQTEGSTSNAQDFMAMVTMLEPQELLKFFAIILNEPYPSVLDNTLSLETATDIAVILCTENDILRIKKNLDQLGKLTQPQEKIPEN